MAVPETVSQHHQVLSVVFTVGDEELIRRKGSEGRRDERPWLSQETTHGRRQVHAHTTTLFTG